MSAPNHPPQHNPDLQTLLDTLSQLSGIPPQTIPPAPPATTALHSASERSFSIPTNSSAAIERPPPDPRLRPQTTPPVRPTSTPPTIDPATITTWPDALRCVTKLAAQNPRFGEKIRKMMSTQRDHEMRWYAERQALKRVHASRAASSAQVASILQSLGGGGTTDLPLATPDNGAQELAVFDRKIYAAQMAMEEAMTAELKGLGVPFFGTEAGCVGSAEEKGEGRPRWSPRVSEAELLELRRRMVGHLEDLYRD